MLTAITGFNVWVTDQDRALEFYVGELGLEVTADVDLGFMRWLTVAVPGQPVPNLVLCPLALAGLEGPDREAAHRLLGKGVLGAAFLATDDCHDTFERLVERGVEVTQSPTQHSYGIDCALRDPFVNQVRIAQLGAVAEQSATTGAGQ